MSPNISTELITVCSTYGAEITGLYHDGEAVPGLRLLLTIAGLETFFGRDRLFVRMEPGYAPDGYYYIHNAEVRKMWSIYGCLAASSFGTFQIMHQTARELGFTGHPILLQDDPVCAKWATTLITKRIIKAQGAKTLVDVLDAYNSGSFTDGNRPKAYIDHGLQIYSALQSV